MSSSVYRIGPNDQFKTIVEICQDSPGERVILVVPEAAPSLMSTANLRLLKAYAADYGKTLVLVTGDKALQALANKAKVAVYPDLQHAELAGYDKEQKHYGQHDAAISSESRLRTEPGAASDVTRSATQATELVTKKRLEPEWPSDAAEIPSRPRKSVWPMRAAVLCVAILAAFALYYLLTPKVVLTIQPATESVSFQANQLLFAGEGLIPFVYEISATTSVPATGSRVVGDRPSTGKITVYNLGLESVQISEGTQVLALGKSKQAFIVTETVNVPIGSVVAGKVVSAGKADVPVKAASPGSQGNLPKNTEFQLTGRLADLPLVVSNSADFTGGSDRLVPVVTQSDIDAAKNRVRQQLQARIEKEWYENAVARGRVVVPEQQLRLAEQYTVSANPGDEADTVSAQGTISASGWLIDADVLWSIVNDSLVQVQLPGYRLLEESVQIQEVKLRQAAESDDTVELVANAVVERMAEIREDLRDSLAGVAVAELSDRLIKVGASPNFSLYPEQIDYLPRWPGWIKMNISSQSQ